MASSDENIFVFARRAKCLALACYSMHAKAFHSMPMPSDLFLFLQVCAWGCGFSILFVARRASAKTIETNFPHVPGDLSLECSKQSGLIRKCFCLNIFSLSGII